jgi:hypothetical protein
LIVSPFSAIVKPTLKNPIYLFHAHCDFLKYFYQVRLESQMILKPLGTRKPKGLSKA